MGMYTEFIFGCELSKNTPKECIDALDYCINDTWENGVPVKKPKYENPQTYEEKRFNENYIDRTTSQKDLEAFYEKYDFSRLFQSCSYYFGAANPIGKFFYDEISDSYHISTRADLKNYNQQIQNFIEYIRPYVIGGSGTKDVFAYVQYEEDDFPTVYTMDGGEYHIDDPKVTAEYTASMDKRWKLLEKLFTELAPEYEITEEECKKYGVEPDKCTHEDGWVMMADYICNKYKKAAKKFKKEHESLQNK